MMPAMAGAYTVDTLGGTTAAPDPAGRQARGQFIRGLMADPPGSWVSDHRREAQAYSGIPYIYIRAKSTAFAAATVEVTYLRKPGRAARKSLAAPAAHARDDGRVPAPASHPLARLFADPNERDTIGDLLADAVTQLELTGSALIYAPRNRRGKPCRLWVVPVPLTGYVPPSPQYPDGGWRVNWAGVGVPFGWGFGASCVLPADQCLWVRYRHPLHRWDGCSPTNAGGRQIDVQNGVDVSRKASLDQAFTPDVVVALAGVNQDEVDRVQALYDARYSGPAGRRVMVTNGDDATAVRTGVPAKELEFGSTYDQSVRSVGALYGVSGTIAQLTEADSYASLFAKRDQFYEGTLKHGAAMFTAAFTKHLARRFWGRRFAVTVNVPAPTDRTQLATQLVSSAGDGTMRLNEIRAARNQPPLPGGDVPVPIYMARLQQQIAPPPAAADPDQPDDDGEPPFATPEEAEDGIGRMAADLLTGGGGPLAKAVGGYREGEVKTDSRGRKYKVVGGKRVPVADAAGRHPSRHNPAVTYGNADDRDSDDRHFGRQVGKTGRAVADARAALAAAEATHAASRRSVAGLRADLTAADGRLAVARRAAQAAAPALARRLPPAMAGPVLSSADRWAGRQADTHAARVAAHLGLSEPDARKLLVRTIRLLCDAARAGGTAEGRLGGIRLSVKRKNPSPKSPETGPPRPANDAGKGSLPPRPQRKAMPSLARYARRLVKAAGRSRLTRTPDPDDEEPDVPETTGYQPSQPQGIANPAVYDETDNTGTPWTDTPASTSIARFRYLDAAGNAKFLRPGGVLEQPIGAGRSELHVQFKGKDGAAGPVYAYYFDAPGAGAEIARKMGETDHPGRDVLVPLVKRAGVPYTRLANG